MKNSRLTAMCVTAVLFSVGIVDADNLTANIRTMLAERR